VTTLVSWNVNGLRAAARKGFLDWLEEFKPDVLGVQETKCQPDQLDPAVRQPEGYFTYFASAEKKGYSGVALYSRIEPLHIQNGIGLPEFDCEGRTLVAEYSDFVLIVAYFPNGSRDHSRVPFKMRYKKRFLDYCNDLRREGKRVVFCGDINTAHNEIDLARPRQNQNTTGFLRVERDWIDEVVSQGYVDTYRDLYPDQEGAYSWWSYIGGARSRNVGWRLDYFFISEDLKPHVQDAAIHSEVMGSDHCPVSLSINLPLADPSRI
jgi:exodeoxyribonuclease-3